MNFIPEQREAEKVPFFEDVMGEQLWQESRVFEKVLPPPDSEFVEGEFSEE